MAVKSCNMWTFLTIVIIAATSLATPIPDPLPPDTPSSHTDVDQKPRLRVRRQYYVCPPEFERISSYCYYFSQNQATWQDAHYDCRDRHSELAVVATAAEDRKLRVQMNRSGKPLEWWIGGIYDWEQMKWKWVSGKRFEYQGFSRMGPENKEKLKWHCTIMDPTMKYKWSSRSCVLGKHYICQKPVMKVNKKKLEKLRRKYNNTLNEIPAPIYEQNLKPRKSSKPRKHENQANGHSKHNLKQYRPNGINIHPDQNRLNNNAYGRKNSTEIMRKGRKEKRIRNKEQRKNRKNKHKNLGLHIRNGNGTELSANIDGFPVDSRGNRKRNRRNKSKENNSKENNSLENATFSQEELNRRKKKLWNNENTSMENITPKTTYMANTLSPLHPRVIVEEHDFMDLNPDNRD